MNGEPCNGWVSSLRGQTICFTGRVFIDGDWVTRDRCARRASRRGAVEKADFSRRITLVIHGDLATKAVTDVRREYSKKLVLAAQERARGHHVCVVDAEGFSDLLAGHPARCRQLRPAEGSDHHILVLPQAGDGVLGGPLQRRRIGRHDTGGLTTDLSRLDEGSEAHEATVTALVDHLTGRGIEVRGHARNAPRFDAGWSRDGEVFIAEIKSLTGAIEDQQIRLGIGQVLDYVHQLRPMHETIRPVLVLERQPTSHRWASLAEDNGILLTWAPDFKAC